MRIFQNIKRNMTIGDWAIVISCFIVGSIGIANVYGWWNECRDAKYVAAGTRGGVTNSPGSGGSSGLGNECRK